MLGGAIGQPDSTASSASPGFLHGAVVDFVSIGGFPTFNVADSCITIGAVLLVLRTLFPGSSARRGDSAGSGTGSGA